MVRGLILLGCLFALSAAIADEDPSEEGQACVQNFAKSEQAIAACQKFPQLYAFVTPVRESEGLVCARKYMDFYCKQSSHEYKHAIDRDGKEVCILDSDQAPVINMCQTSPKSFCYIKLRP